MSDDKVIINKSVRQHNDITNAYIPFTRNGARLFVGILSSLKENQYDYTYRVIDLMRFLGIESDNYSMLVEAIEELYELSIPIKNGINESVSESDDYQIRMLSARKFPAIKNRLKKHKKYDNLPLRERKKLDKDLIDQEGVLKTYEDVKVTISNKIAPYLFDLKKNFTHYEVESFLRLNSVYSQKLYTLFAQYKSTGLLIRSFEQLQDIFGTSYGTLSNFKNKVLNGSIDEIMDKTNINRIKIEPLKDGRKITGYRFLFKWNQQLDIFNKEERDEIKKFSPVVNRIAQRLIDDFRLSPKQAFKVVNNVSPEEINKELYDLNIQIKNNKINSIGGYTVTLFKEKYGVN